MNGTAHQRHLALVYAPATDTIELPSAMRGVEPPTRELHVLDLRPTVPVRYVRTDRYQHLRASVASAFWPLAIGAGVIVALLVIAHLNGAAPVSTAGIR